jgi:PadR family transcriptional regulator PadR
MKIERELLKGTAPIAVLQILSRGAMYGYELGQAIEEKSGGILTFGHGTLYPLLYNLEARGLLCTEWQQAASGRERRYYSITGKGKKHLAEQRAQWEQLDTAMKLIFEAATV